MTVKRVDDGGNSTRMANANGPEEKHRQTRKLVAYDAIPALSKEADMLVFV